MYCKYCGGQLQGAEKFCGHCGKPVAETKTDAKTAQKDFCSRCGQVIREGETVCAFCNQPVGGNANAAPFYTPPANGSAPVGPASVEKKGTGLGVAGILLALLSPLVGFILGFMAIKQGKGSSNKTAVVLGIVAIVVAAIMVVLNVIYIYSKKLYY